MSLVNFFHAEYPPRTDLMPVGTVAVAEPAFVLGGSATKKAASVTPAAPAKQAEPVAALLPAAPAKKTAPIAAAPALAHVLMKKPTPVPTLPPALLATLEAQGVLDALDDALLTAMFAKGMEEAKRAARDASASCNWRLRKTLS